MVKMGEEVGGLGLFVGGVGVSGWAEILWDWNLGGGIFWFMQWVKLMGELKKISTKLGGIVNGWEILLDSSVTIHHHHHCLHTDAIHHELTYLPIHLHTTSYGHNNKAAIHRIILCKPTPCGIIYRAH